MKSKNIIKTETDGTDYKTTKPTRFEVKDDQFRVSAYSHPGGIICTCVAVAITHKGVAVRNSNDEKKDTVFFSHAEWDAFVKGVKDGEFDVKS